MVALAFAANGTTAVLQKADAASGSSDGFSWALLILWERCAFLRAGQWKRGVKKAENVRRMPRLSCFPREMRLRNI